MAKTRVHELAKEFGVESKFVLEKFKEMGEFVKSASPTVELPAEMRFRKEFGEKLKAEQASAPAAEKPAEKPAAKPAAKPAPKPAAQPADDFLWLEEVEGERAMEWVHAHNATTAAALQAEPVYDALYADALAVLTSDDRIAMPSILGDAITNFWTDEDNPRGIWRRASWASYLTGDPEWETLLDIDALGAAEAVAGVERIAATLRNEA